MSSHQLEPPPPPLNPPPPPNPPKPPPPPPPKPPPPHPPPPPLHPPRPNPPTGIGMGMQPGPQPPHPRRRRPALLKTERMTKNRIIQTNGGIPPPLPRGRSTDGSESWGGGASEVSSWKLNSLANRCAVRRATSS